MGSLFHGEIACVCVCAVAKRLCDDDEYRAERVQENNKHRTEN